MSPRVLIFLGLSGIFLSLFGILIVTFNRLRRLGRGKRAKTATGKELPQSPGIIATLRNLVVLLLVLVSSILVFFIGFFGIAYDQLTYEQPIAKITISPADTSQMMVLELERMTSDSTPVVYRYLLKGDMWMLEGDILKWDNWLSFLGLHTRYRLTRLRGRYVSTEEERVKEATIYSLVKKENDPVWRFLYRWGTQMPFVSTVYGNAVYQFSTEPSSYYIYVGTSGFIVRPIDNE
ncbi:MAG: hypothetical protein D6748_07265 [Calditrichaeota bacterium]|nr:MAG: hypothetical protein D6748_07265 [Calditrichota bacterium]